MCQLDALTGISEFVMIAHRLRLRPGERTYTALNATRSGPKPQVVAASDIFALSQVAYFPSGEWPSRVLKK
jgi:hypothetical protein